MRIAVCDLGTGDLDILLLDEEAEEAFNRYEDASRFFEDLGYNTGQCSWMVINGFIKEYAVTAKDTYPQFKEK